MNEDIKGRLERAEANQEDALGRPTYEDLRAEITRLTIRAEGAEIELAERQHVTAPDPADTVIEAVALAISKHRHGSQAVWDEDRRLARALHDAGLLLSDPADQDSTTQWQRANIAEVKAERAEAEVARLNQQFAETRSKVNAYSVALVAELRATVARVTGPVRSLLERLDECGHGDYRIHPDDGACVICDRMAEIRAALDGAGEQ